MYSGFVHSYETTTKVTGFRWNNCQPFWEHVTRSHLLSSVSKRGTHISYSRQFVKFGKLWRFFLASIQELVGNYNRWILCVVGGPFENGGTRKTATIDPLKVVFHHDNALAHSSVLDAVADLQLSKPVTKISLRPLFSYDHHTKWQHKYAIIICLVRMIWKTKNLKTKEETIYHRPTYTWEVAVKMFYKNI